MFINTLPFVFTEIRKHSFFEKLAITSLASFVLALSGNISIPMYPVPGTLQSCVILLIGAILGRKLGIVTVVQTIFLGFLGFPVFANGANSMLALLSPSAGYIYGFFLSVYLAGLASEYALKHKYTASLMMFIVAHQSIFLVGVIYLSKNLHVSLQEAFFLGYMPFIPFEIIKLMVAIITMKLLWYNSSK